MQAEERKRRESERYSRLKSLDPRNYERAVCIGSLVACDVGLVGLDLDVRLRIAAKVESAVVAAILDALATGGNDAT